MSELLRKCLLIQDVVLMLEDNGVDLTDDRQAIDLLNWTAKEIFDYGERLHADEDLWRRVPDVLSANWSRDDLRAYLRRTLTLPPS